MQIDQRKKYVHLLIWDIIYINDLKKKHVVKVS